MASAISNTSPLLYLYRIQALHMLPHPFDSVMTPPAVVDELDEGRRKGFDVPNPLDYPWLEIRQPAALPSEWLALDLGAGELAAMTLALEMPGHIVLLDDMLARRTAHAAGLTVLGDLAYSPGDESARTPDPDRTIGRSVERRRFMDDSRYPSAYSGSCW
jgi:hypothetical protein